MTILQEVYASAPNDKILIHTLQVSHSSIDTLYFARAYEDLSATLENGADVTFAASGIAMQLPQRGIRGREDLVFQLDNVTGVALDAVDTMMEDGGTAEITYRGYVSTDLTGPQETVRLIATSVKANAQSVAITATFREFINKAWPRRRYTLANYPGLKYQNG